MRISRRGAYAIATLVLIVAGLLTRWPAIAWPPGVAKYLGSALWGAMVFCAVGICWPHLSRSWIALLAFLIAAATEFSQLWHSDALDAFRRTTIGVLLIGRYFSWVDIAAYAVGILAAAFAAERWSR
ncbi:MAG: DUF2809 domain-containing protein [Pseudomonadota bacterium]